MKDKLKRAVRASLRTLRLDITRNLRYDRLTEKVIARAVGPDTLCVDVGCHQGEIMDIILNRAPAVRHFGFEPLPSMAAALRSKYVDRVRIMECALSNQIGIIEFQHVRNAPAYSGILRRTYATSRPDVETIQVHTKRMDDAFDQELLPGFIKIDVEGGEMDVLRGADRIIREARPVVLFECGLGASEHYGTQPEEVHQWLTERGMGVWLLASWLRHGSRLSEAHFSKHFHLNDEYYFLSAPL